MEQKDMLQINHGLFYNGCVQFSMDLSEKRLRNCDVYYIGRILDTLYKFLQTLVSIIK